MIWHLAIETSGREASIALLQGNHLVRELNLTVEQRTTASFAPAIQTLLQSIPAGDPPLGLVSVSVGPGSFTGLRIGVTAAKTLCFALKSDLVAVDSLAIICQQQREAWLANPDQFPAAAQRIAVCTNAYRGQLFIRTEHLDEKIAPADVATEIVDRSRWDELLAAMDIYAVGRRVAEPLPNRDASATEPSAASEVEYGTTFDGWPRPMAATLGRLAWKMYQSGKRDDYWSLVPRYLRKSAAEEMADEKDNRQNSAGTYSQAKKI